MLTREDFSCFGALDARPSAGCPFVKSLSMTLDAYFSMEATMLYITRTAAGP